MDVRVIHGDSLEVLPTLSGLDACVCDPPYHLTSIVKRFGAANAAPAQYGKDGAYKRASTGFMGKAWDTDIAFQVETWRLVYNALKPGAHLVAFGGTRTFHRMACAIEDAGFEIRDTLCWLYGSGFPKSHDVSKQIDKMAGAEREVIGPGTRHNSKRCAVAHGDTERLAGGVPDITAPATPEAAAWAGWGTALKPAYEPILVYAKPLTVEQHIAICIDAITERLSWSDYSAPDAINTLNAIRAKCGAAVSFVLGSAKTRSLVSIGSAPSAELLSTFSVLELRDPIRTKDCFALSHVRQSGRDQPQSESAIRHGAVADLLTRLADISMFAATDPMSASIVLSWSSISDVLLAEASKFTISTAIRLTIALRTLNYSLLPNTTDATGASSPNFEPIILARKPLQGTVAANVLAYGTGAINVDACRVGLGDDRTTGGPTGKRVSADEGYGGAWADATSGRERATGARWPANVIHDGSPEVEASFAQFGEKASGVPGTRRKPHETNSMSGRLAMTGEQETGYADAGSVSRYFYCAKADSDDRAWSKHPTVKPIALIRWLVRLVTPPGGTVLDCFAGSGTTGEAARLEGFNAVLIEREAEYYNDILIRLGRASGADTPLFAGLT